MAKRIVTVDNQTATIAEIQKRALSNEAMPFYGGIQIYSGTSPSFNAPGYMIGDLSAPSHRAIYYPEIKISCSKNAQGFLRPLANSSYLLQETYGNLLLNAGETVSFRDIVQKQGYSKYEFRISDVFHGIAQWVAAKYVNAGEKRFNGANVYIATNAGVTGATAPVHTTGGVSDGTITWQYDNTLLSYKDFYASMYGSGYQLTDDFDYKADKVILFIGDSIMDASGLSAKVKSFYWQIRQWYRETQGIRVRVVNLSYGGLNSSQLEAMRNAGLFDVEKVDMIYYGGGMNDAAQSVSTATFTTNINNLIKWKQKIYPNTKLIVQGITPANNTTTNTNTIALRTAAQNAVNTAKASDPSLYYLDTTTAFDRTVLSNYVNSDGIHPNDASTGLLFNNVIKPYLLANIPTI